jgi:hypothetical protein
MVNKIKAVFAAIGSIGVLMSLVGGFLWLFTNYPGNVIEFFIVSWFAFCGYRAYMYFLERFKKESDNEQINS